jgi:glycosyltransferase involved in cell wall biosynthesis
MDWIGNNVRFSSHKDYKSFLSHSSIFINLSHASANPRSRTEAMMCGLVIVTTGAHGEEEYIENGKNGFVSADENELLARVEELRKNPSRVRLMGMAGRETAQKYFSKMQFQESWEKLLRKVSLQ